MEGSDGEENSCWGDGVVSDGFDYPEGVPVRYITHGLGHYDCEKYSMYPNPTLVKLYAKLGIHRYNLLEGTNWEFSKLKSFNMRMNCGAAPYYITLAAKPKILPFYPNLPSSDLLQIFHVQVSEEDLGVLDLTCPIARPRVTNSCSSTTGETTVEVPFYVSTRLPHWPSSFNDANRFCLVDLSDVSYYDWINLYLELAYCAYDRGITDVHLSKFNLKIVQVAIESPDGPLIDSKTAVVYIVYKDLNKGCDCKAIFRRIYDEATGSFSLKGKYWGKASKKKRSAMRRRLSVHRIWRFLRLR